MIKVILSIINLIFGNKTKEEETKMEENEFNSKYYTLEDFTKSDTADEYGLDNTPNEEEIKQLEWLCIKILDPLTHKLGKKLTISSGFRSKEVNSHPKVGGSKKSQHCYGKASDISFDGMTAEELFYFIIEETSLPFDQIILEFSRWVHISYDRAKSKQRHSKMIASIVNEKARYTHI